MRYAQITYTIRDAKAQTAQILIYVRFQDTILEPSDDPAQFASEFAEVLDRMISGVIINISVSISAVLPAGIKVTPESYSDVQEGAKMQFTAVGGVYFQHRIPTIYEDLISPGSKDVDTTTAELVEYQQWMLVAPDLPASWAVRVTEERGEPLLSLISAKENFKRRK